MTSSMLQMKITILSGEVKKKMTCYVSYKVDDNIAKKTTTTNVSSENPKWEEESFVLVTPFSKIEFELFNAGNLRSFGTHMLDLHKVLTSYAGKLENCIFKLDLTKMERNRRVSVGKLSVRLDGINIDMSLYPLRPRTAARPSVTGNRPNTNSSSNNNSNGRGVGSSRQNGENTPSSLPAPAAASSSSDPSEVLPEYYERCVDEQGRPYYVDHLMCTTHWERPTPLPPGWGRRRDQNTGRQYYVDHNTCTTTWERPDTQMLSNIHDFESRRNQQNANVNYSLNRVNLLNMAEGGGSTGRGASSYTSSSTPVAKPTPKISGALPEGWESRFDQNNRLYYVNHINKITQWEDPRTQGLPEGWEMRFSDDGRAFYMDHKTKTTTFLDPREGLGTSSSDESEAVNGERKLETRICRFRYLCECNQVTGHLKLLLSRANLMEDSFVQISRYQPFELRKRLYITFKGEEGLDYGGIAREWFILLSHELLNPMYCLFQYASSTNYALQINPGSHVEPDHLAYFRFVGKFMAMALFHAKFLDSGFTLPFYKKMLNKRLSLKDLETVDGEYYQSLCYINDNEINDAELGMYFVVNQDVLGEVKEVELKPGGKDIEVTDENKAEYIELVVNWRFEMGVEEQTKALLEGFRSVVPLQWLQYFCDKELEMMLCGIQKFDVDDWENNTIYKNYTKSAKPIVWFWKFVRSQDHQGRTKLLQFVTGTCRLPVGGFCELMGSNGPQRFCVEKIGKETWLPRSHTCFNRLDLPPYKSYEQLCEKLLIAINETEGFGQE